MIDFLAALALGAVFESVGSFLIAAICCSGLALGLPIWIGFGKVWLHIEAILARHLSHAVMHALDETVGFIGGMFMMFMTFAAPVILLHLVF